MQRRVAVGGADADAGEDGAAGGGGGGNGGGGGGYSGGVETGLRATGEPYRLYNLDIFKYDERTEPYPYPYPYPYP